MSFQWLDLIIVCDTLLHVKEPRHLFIIVAQTILWSILYNCCIYGHFICRFERYSTVEQSYAWDTTQNCGVMIICFIKGQILWIVQSYRMDHSLLRMDIHGALLFAFASVSLIAYAVVPCMWILHTVYWAKKSRKSRQTKGNFSFCAKKGDYLSQKSWKPLQEDAVCRSSRKSQSLGCNWKPRGSSVSSKPFFIQIDERAFLYTGSGGWRASLHVQGSSIGQLTHKIDAITTEDRTEERGLNNAWQKAERNLFDLSMQKPWR